MSIKNYSVYSTDSGLLNIDDIINQDFTKKTNKAVLTDYNTLMGVPEFMEKCKAKGVEPIVGVTITIGDASTKEGNITLYAKNEKGFDNLKKIVSSLSEDEYKEKYTSLSNVINNAENLIALTGGHNTIVYNMIKSGNNSAAAKHIYNLKKVFKNDVNFEVQVNYLENEDKINQEIIKYAEEMNVNLYATNDQRMRNEGHYPLLVEKIKTKRGKNNKNNVHIKEQVLASNYIKSNEQMRRNFEPYLSKVQNVSSLFSEFTGYDIFIDLPDIPNFPNIKDDNHFFNVLNEEYKKFIKTIPEEKRPIYLKRLKEEVSIIKELNFEKYFIIFDQIEKNKVENQRFNLRGSSVSFLTTHILGLSDIDPVAYGLLPERFLNKNRLIRHELPDIDLESNNVGSVMKYLVNTFGEKSTAYLSNNEKPKAKSQIELAERALKEDITNNPTDAYGKERVFPHQDFKLLKKVLTSMYGYDKMTLDDAFSKGYVSKKKAGQVFGLGFNYNSKEFKNEYYKIANLKKLCDNNPNIKKIVGYIKTLDNAIISHGISTASVVVSNKPINTFFSTHAVKDTKSSEKKDVRIAIEATKKYVEKLGLIKLDILSNKYLHKLELAYNITGLPWDDGDYENKYSNKNVYDMIAKGYTGTLNQVKSLKQQELAERIKVQNFDELVAFLALIRPGVGASDIDKYIENKNNTQAIQYDHPDMKDILKSTHGIIIFEEQIMQISQKIGNFSKEESDDLRSLMKKIGDSNKKDDNFYKLERMKKELVTRAIEQNNISPDVATNIISKLEEMQGYTFSKAHSLSYAGLLYRQAFIDVNYPAEYIESHLILDNNRVDDKDEMNGYLQKLTLMDRMMLNSDINRSQMNFKTRRKNDVIFIDPSLKFITKDEDFSNLIIKERENRKFENMYDFVERTIQSSLGRTRFSGEWLDDSDKKVSSTTSYKNNVSTLIKAGAFDSIIPPELKSLGVNVSRTALLSSLDNAIELATNPFSMEDFVYDKPEEGLSIEATLENEKIVYGFSPTELRNIVSKKKKQEVKPNINDKKKSRNRP